VPGVNLKDILPEDHRDEVWKNIGSSLRVKRWPASKQVWDVLERVIRDETGVTNFSEDSRFVEDMHID
jgi:hypothetical protein